MKVSKEQFLSVMSSVEDFEIIKNKSKKNDDDGLTMVKWKGQTLIVLFNETELPSEIKDDDDVDSTVSFDYAISLLVMAKKNLVNVEPLVKYKIANYVNMKSEFSSIVIYREDLDLFTIDVRHNAFMSSNSPHDIKLSFISMVLTGAVTSRELYNQIEAYKNSPEKFLEECIGLHE